MLRSTPLEIRQFLSDGNWLERQGSPETFAPLIRLHPRYGAKVVELDDLIFIAPQDEWAFDVEILNRNLHIATLNQQWMEKEGPTDVLAFPMDEDEEAGPGWPPGPEGPSAVRADRTARRSRRS